VWQVIANTSSGSLSVGQEGTHVNKIEISGESFSDENAPTKLVAGLCPDPLGELSAPPDT